MPVVRLVVQQLADMVADAEGRGRVGVPDLGPGAVMDQLAVMVYDAAQAGLAGSAAEALTGLRKDLA